jgi:hypothetical protein
LEKGSPADKVSEAIFEALRLAPVRLEELHAFAQSMALSYLALTSSRNPDSFSATQLEPMCQLIKRGVKVEWLIAAIERAAVVAAELLKEQKVTLSFATVIAKMVAAQANLKAAG